jgi:hypothetical protein
MTAGRAPGLIRGADGRKHLPAAMVSTLRIATSGLDDRQKADTWADFPNWRRQDRMP